MIRFKIVNYHDEVKCNVIPMDACHILLVRPWKFDRHIMHNGRANRYIFLHGGRIITLLPLPSSSLNGIQENTKKFDDKRRKKMLVEVLDCEKGKGKINLFVGLTHKCPSILTNLKASILPSRRTPYL